MKTNVLEIQMELEKKYWRKKKHIFKQLTISLPSLALISVSKEREGLTAIYVFVLLGARQIFVAFNPLVGRPLMLLDISL